MTLRMVEAPDYSGESGLAHIRRLQQAMERAISEDDWRQIRQLDKACGIAIERVIESCNGDLSTLRSALRELKGIYAQLIMKSKCDEQAIAI